MYGKTTPRIFLSYAPEDKEIVEELYQKLQAAGFQPWMDSKDILPGEAWQTKIKEAIENSEFFLACLSNNSVSKRGILQKEFKIAQDVFQEKLDNDIYIIPIRLDKCSVPENMEHLQQLNLFEKNGFARLELAIRKGAQQYANMETAEFTSVSQSETKIKYPPQHPKSPPKSIFAKRAISIGLGALIAVIGIPWLYNHYIYRVPHPILPLTCQVSTQPVRVGVGQLTNCPETFQKQLIDNWKSDLSSPTAIANVI